MREQQVVVSNRLGLHARAAARLVQTVQPFAATVTLRYREHEVNAKSIMGVMMLAAAQGAALTVRAEGADAEAALAAVQRLFEDRFGEGG